MGKTVTNRGKAKYIRQAKAFKNQGAIGLQYIVYKRRSF